MTDERSFRSLMVRLDRAGFSRAFVSRAVLPDWWSGECASDPSVLPEVEVGVARFLGVSLQEVRDPSRVLKPRGPQGAQLKTVAGYKRADVLAAMHAGVAVAAAVVRNLRVRAEVLPLPEDPVAWRQQLLTGEQFVTLPVLVGDLWRRGIPVVHLDVVPTPKFQGMACVVEDRPVILLAYRDNAPAWHLFHAAHEAGHIGRGHVTATSPVVDREVPTARAPQGREREANEYASLLLRGHWTPSAASRSTAGCLATSAAATASLYHLDVGHVVLSWGWAKNGHYPTARAALKVLRADTGGLALLRSHFDQQVDLDGASDSDRALLGCVTGMASGDASAAG